MEPPKAAKTQYVSIPYKQDLLDHLQKLVFFLEFQDANPFKIRAFKNAQDILDGLSNEDLVKGVKTGSLTEIKGIGKGILSLAQSLLNSGSSQELKDAMGELPETLFELRQVKGLGGKKIKSLYEELQISSLGELEYACNENRLTALKGFGDKLQHNIRAEIEALKMNQGKLLLPDALEIEASLKLLAVGALGQRREIIEDVEFLVTDEKLKKPSKTKFQHPIVIHLCSPEAFALESLKRTSSDVFFSSLEKISKKKNVDLKTGHFKNENEIFEKLGLPYFPREAREFSVEEAKNWTPLTTSDITGVFHLHTIASDGLNTLEEMATAAKKHGWSYMGLSDHSQTASYAGGLKEADLSEQWKAIENLEKRMNGFRILKGMESDILKDGSLDYPVSTLKKFDFVIASIHARYGMKEMTDRLIAAIENRYTSMIGHISGRLLLARDAYDFDVQRIVDAAIANKRVIEFNSHPQRLDLDWRILRKACERGLIISLNPDAHAVSGFDDIRYGIWMANKAFVPKEQILNTWPLQKIEAFLIEQRA